MEVKSISREVEEDVVGSGRRRRIHRWSRDVRAACSFASSVDFFLFIFRRGYENNSTGPVLGLVQGVPCSRKTVNMCVIFFRTGVVRCI